MKRLYRVAVIQPSVPKYRVPLFVRLIAAAAEQGVHIDVYRGETPTEDRDRDDAGDAPFVHLLDTRELSIQGLKLFYKSVTTIRRGDYDLVIIEHAVHNLEAYELLARLGRRRVAFWGHGRTYTKGVPSHQEAFKYWLTRRATWFFGYTERGVDAVVEHGFPRKRTTTLRNTIDTSALSADLATISEAELLKFSHQHDLRGATALYLGGLDKYKRVSFLLESAAIAHQNCSDFRLLIAGNGSDRHLVDEFVSQNPWATYLGTAHGRNKARALAASQALCIPGRIGLVAVDSMAAGIPIVTTSYRYHAPEFDYLEDGLTVVVAKDNAESYAAELIDLLNDGPRQKEMANRCRIEAQKYTIDGMVRNFLTGIESALSYE